ncbi:MAG: tetratricopeptide repeat protein [Cyanobium sp.]
MPSDLLLHQALERLSGGDPEAAGLLLRQLLSQPPESAGTVAEAARQLARLCSRRGDHHEAIALLQGALFYAPDDGSLWGELASEWLAAGDPEASLACWESCECLGAGSLERRHDHGVALLESGRAEAARQRFEQLLEEQPAHPRIRANLAHALEAVARGQFEEGRWAASLLSLEQALGLFDQAAMSSDAPTDADHPEAELLAVLPDNTGIVLQSQGRLPEAIAAHEQALAFAPARAESHFHLGLALLLSGRLERGWPEYAWRFQTPHAARLCAAVPPPRPWDLPCGEGPLRLIGEQGLGDMLQFLRYVREAEERHPDVQLCLPEKLHGLARSSEIHCPLLSPTEAESRADGPWIPLMSLPLQLGMHGSPDIGAHPYLRIPEERLRYWRRRLQEGLAPGTRLLGLHWQGNPALERFQHRGRSFPLELLAPLARLPGMRLLSLQRGFGAEQWRSCSFREAFVNHQEELDAVLDFVEIGAMASACDRVISSDSAMAHLVGGLGLPAWLLLRHVPDWRWGLAGERTPWYPTLRLLRQNRPDDWCEPIARAVGLLHQGA